MPIAGPVNRLAVIVAKETKIVAFLSVVADIFFLLKQVDEVL